MAGFEAVGGPVRIDGVSLTPIRFPSANMLRNAQLHEIQPTYVEDRRVRYERLPRKVAKDLRESSRVKAFQSTSQTSPRFYQEDAFLHNGRLDDVGPRWTFPPQAMGYSVVLTETRHISHLVLYLNNATPDNVYSFIAILAQNVEKGMPEKVALVRNNERRFVVVHFKEPIRTDTLKILPGKHPPHKQAITEIELYGPVGGLEDAEPELAGAPADIPMLMDTPRHVVESPPEDLTGTFEAARSAGLNLPAFPHGATVADDRYTAGQAPGVVRGNRRTPHRGKPRVKPAGAWNAGDVTPLGTPARYAGRLVVGSADDRVRAVTRGGRPLWSFRTGGRVHASPTPDGHNVFVGSDDGNLYKLDIDSGMRIWSYETDGRIRGGPALADGRVYIPSWAGHLHAVDAQNGNRLWKSAIARYTRAAPAVADGRVYLGDEQGVARAFDAESGSVIWEKPLKGRFSHCPVVTDEGILFVADQGRVVSLSDAGDVQWRRTLDARVLGQPIPTRSQLLVPTAKGPRVLRQADGKDDPRFEAPADRAPRTVAAMPHDGTLWMTSARGTLEDVQKGGGSVIQTSEAGKVRLWIPKEEKESE
jgi:outer membrane protein assembly factor BamB